MTPTQGAAWEEDHGVPSPGPNLSELVDLDQLGFETRAIHAGAVDPVSGAVNTPVYFSSTFKQDAVGRHRGHDYARTSNPTRASLEANLASLERAAFGLAFASGMASEDAVMRLLAPGDHLLLPTDSYGGTYRLATKVLAPAGLAVSTCDLSSPAQLEAALTPRTRMVWVETPTNPLLKIVDIGAACATAHRLGALVVVDNTFASPYLQQPLVLGADIVVHSTTKYLAGHSDVIGGFAATNSAELATRLAFLQNAAGAVPGPMDCFLVQRGLKTLAVRMERHCSSALTVVDALRSHPAVGQVFHPSLPDHPGHEVARRQMSGFGGMVSFTLKGGEDAALDVCRRARIFTLAESLGAVESLIEHPARMTHASTAGSTNEVRRDLVRLSVGLETVADLVADLRQALDAVG